MKSIIKLIKKFIKKFLLWLANSSSFLWMIKQLVAKKFNTIEKFYYLNTDIIRWLGSLLTKMKIVEITINNSDRIPHLGPVVLACSHKSELDILILTLVTDRVIRFLAKIELFLTALGNFWFTSGGVIPIDRENPSRESIKAQKNVLKNNGVLGYYPGGTRYKGEGIGELNDGIAMIVRLSQKEIKQLIPVVPIVINYRKNPIRSQSRFKIVVNIGEPIRMELKSKEDQPIFVAKLKEAMSALVIT